MKKKRRRQIGRQIISWVLTASMVLPNTAVLVADAAEQVKNMPRYVDFSRPSALTLNELGLSGAVGGNSSGRNSAAQGDDKDQSKGSGTEGSQPKSSSQEESGSDGKRTEDSKTGSSSSKKEEESGSEEEDSSQAGSGTDDSGADGEPGDGSDLDSAKSLTVPRTPAP